MSGFIDALVDPSFPFLRNALLAGLAGSLAFGVVGTFVVVRRITYSAAAIAHCLLAGVALGLFAQRVLGWTWLSPFGGSLIVGIGSAMLLVVLARQKQEREDSAIGVIWTFGMAIGLLVLARTPGYTDPSAYLFGDMLLLSGQEVWLVAGLGLAVTGTVLLSFRRLQAICFDEEFSRLRGLPTDFFGALLLVLTAITVALMSSLVGIILVVALLTLPAALAGKFTQRLGSMMLLATVLCAVFVSGGLALSFESDLPAGPVIICLAGGAYLLAFWMRRKSS